MNVLDLYLKENDIKTRFGESVYLEKIVYFKEDKRVYFYLFANKIIFLKDLDDLKKELKKKLKVIKDVKFKMNYEIKDGNNFIFDYISNIEYSLKKLAPSLNKKTLNIEFNKNEILLNIKDLFAIELLERKKICNFIQKAIQEELKTNILVKIKKEDINVDKIEFFQRQENDLKEKLIQTSEAIQNIEHKKDIQKPKKEIDNFSGKRNYKRVSFWSNIEKESILDIKSITPESGEVCIRGELFNMDIRELKNGNVLMILSLTDFTSSINCKTFLKENQWQEIKEFLKLSNYFTIKGNAVFDTYSKELVVNIVQMYGFEKPRRIDTSLEKRVELHAHTQMSAMDATVSAKDLIKEASDLGHKSIAITDHGVVQSFPEAMDAGKKFGVKIIYGMEGYLIDDENPVIKNPNKKALSQEFVVFDIETTGFSNTRDSIIEIGAVKIKNFEIIDKFSYFVNPNKEIPYKIQELTGITNSMVKDSKTIDDILPEFLDFIGDSVLVAHNSDFDTGFIREKSRNLNLEYSNEAIDTIRLAKVLLPNLKRYKLDVVAKALDISLQNHHRAVDDAKATAMIFLKFLDKLKQEGLETLDQVNFHFKETDYKKIRPNHITLLVKNQIGLKNLYKLVSKSHMDYFYKTPRIPKSLLKNYREGILIGGACEAGEVYQAILKNKKIDEINEIVKFYDYLEIMPLENNDFMIKKGIVKSKQDLIDINKKIIQIAKENNKLVVATGDVHFLRKNHAIFRSILKFSQGFSDANEETPLYYRTTNEMLDAFDYLGSKLAKEVVIENTNKISELVEEILPIPNETYPPIIEGSEENLRSLCNEKAHNIYGEVLPEVVEKRLNRELNSIISNGYAVMYIIAQKLVYKSIKDGYLVGSRGSVGSSFAATMSGITEVNPLPPHYICNKCKHSEFFLKGEYASGADLPDKNCPNCMSVMDKEGHDIPFEVFLGFEGDKEPDIDLNFAGEYQANAHKYTEKLFGSGYTFKAGTIGTIADKTAYGFVKKYVEENNLFCPNVEIERLSKGCTGIKRTTGQHPGGIMVVPNYKEVFDFTPIQYPANDKESGVVTTHFDYHSISGRILKLDILGHDVPTIIKMIEDMTKTDATKVKLDDKRTMSLFNSTKELNIDLSEIGCTTGTLGIPEFGTKFVRQMLVDTNPTTFSELVRISGLSHGTDVWVNNAQDLVRKNVVGLKEVISTRDDIMNYLIYKGVKPKTSFKIMEKVRKGKGLTQEDEEDMKSHNVPQWYIDSCNKIKYMFPKAHAVAYVMMSFRIAYYKVFYPETFYATYFTTKAEDFDISLIIKGKDAILDKIKEIENIGNEATAKDKSLYTVLEVAFEMYLRDIKLLNVDLYDSDATKFKLKENYLLPPLISIQGLGSNAALNIVNEREKEKFLSIEDLRTRCKVSKTVIETLRENGCLNGMDETNQLSLL